MSSITHYLEKYGLLSLEKQTKFSQLVGEHTMELDLDSGRIRISDSFQFPIQVLGTESDNSLTWLWAWAEEQPELPPELLRSAFAMRAWGAREGLEECTLPAVDLNKADGHVLSLIASEICKASCYYQDAYQGGGLFLLLFGSAIDSRQPFNGESLSLQFLHLISLYEFNHANAFRSYFIGKGLPITEHASFIVGKLESGEDVRANFASSHRLISINGKEISEV